jgi:hypothetical protein
LWGALEDKNGDREEGARAAAEGRRRPLERLGWQDCKRQEAAWPGH